MVCLQENEDDVPMTEIRNTVHRPLLSCHVI
jgi:hypothetical protein